MRTRAVLLAALVAAVAFTGGRATAPDGSDLIRADHGHLFTIHIPTGRVVPCDQ